MKPLLLPCLFLFILTSTAHAKEQWVCRFKGDDYQVVLTNLGDGYKAGQDDDWLSSEDLDYIRVVNTDVFSPEYLLAFFVKKKTGKAVRITHIGSVGLTTTEEGLCVKR